MSRALLALLLCLLPLAEGGAKPTRIVSMNLCADELVLRLADPAHVLSVTWLSRDRQASNVVGLAGQVAANHGLAEEIIALRPDLVLAGLYTTRTTVGLLRRVGLPVVELDVPVTLEAVYRQIRDLAAVLEEGERGEALIATIESGLDGLSPRADGRRPSALVFNPSGFTVERDSLVDELLRRAGLRNLAVELGLDGYGQIPLEVLVLARPDLLVVAADPEAGPALAYEALRHPVLARLPRDMRVIVLPSRLWTCAGPALVDAVQRLAAAVEALP